MKIRWPSFNLPPINLWNAPQQPSLHGRRRTAMVTRVTFPTVPGEWVPATEYDALVASLARLKAEWQASALEDFADDMTIEQNRWSAHARAHKLRRRAGTKKS